MGRDNIDLNFERSLLRLVRRFRQTTLKGASAFRIDRHCRWKTEIIETKGCQPIESSNAFGCPGLISLKYYVECVYNILPATIVVFFVPFITLTLEVVTFSVAVAIFFFITLGFAIIWMIAAFFGISITSPIDWEALIVHIITVNISEGSRTTKNTKCLELLRLLTTLEKTTELTLRGSENDVVLFPFLPKMMIVRSGGDRIDAENEDFEIHCYL
mmetsp:Transcript_22481/g.38333  ORF Transcript_22481/g.38333 Transcript_22481/m.38333 type:complete len:215 (+) Transcript_22481:530-1174(+)